MKEYSYLSMVFAHDVWWDVVSEHKNDHGEEFYYCFSKDDDEYITFMEHEVDGLRYSMKEE
jgi:hypothetical protein